MPIWLVKKPSAVISRSKGEESTPEQGGRFVRVFAIGDQIENFLLLLNGTFEVWPAIAVTALPVQPHQAAAKS